MPDITDPLLPPPTKWDDLTVRLISSAVMVLVGAIGVNRIDDAAPETLEPGACGTTPPTVESPEFLVIATR